MSRIACAQTSRHFPACSGHRCLAVLSGLCCACRKAIWNRAGSRPDGSGRAEEWHAYEGRHTAVSLMSSNGPQGVLIPVGWSLEPGRHGLDPRDQRHPDPDLLHATPHCKQSVCAGQPMIQNQ